MEDPILFDPSDPEHKTYLSQMAEIHIACIETDKTMAVFLPPLNHDRIVKFYEQDVREIEYGNREIILQLVTVGEGNKARKFVGGFVILARRIGPDGQLTTQTGHFRGDVFKLLVSPNHRKKGIAKRVMTKLEEVALRTGTTLLACNTQCPYLLDNVLALSSQCFAYSCKWQMLDTAVGSPAENVYPRLGYKRVGVIPKYGVSPVDNKTLNDEVFFYKDLRDHTV